MREWARCVRCAKLPRLLASLQQLLGAKLCAKNSFEFCPTWTLEVDLWNWCVMEFVNHDESFCKHTEHLCQFRLDALKDKHWLKCIIVSVERLSCSEGNQSQVPVQIAVVTPLSVHIYFLKAQMISRTTDQRYMSNRIEGHSACHTFETSNPRYLAGHNLNRHLWVLNLAKVMSCCWTHELSERGQPCLMQRAGSAILTERGCCRTEGKAQRSNSAMKSISHPISFVTSVTYVSINVHWLKLRLARLGRSARRGITGHPGPLKLWCHQICQTDPNRTWDSQ